MPAIVAEHITKTFGTFIAVDDVSLEIPEGEIFGFLGSNGAGKSTLIRMLCGLLAPTSGKGLVAGYSINTETERVKKNIGYMSQKFSLYNDLTVEENITFFAGAYGISNKRFAERKAWALKTAHLEDKARALARSLAGGWKQRLALVCALLHEPKVVFLDEPTGGVDPVSRREFWDLIRSLAADGITIFVTTHFLDEAEQCTSIGLIHAGKLIAKGPLDNLKTANMPYPIIELACDRPVEAMELLEKQNFVIETSIFGTNIHVVLKKELDFRSAVETAFSGTGIVVSFVDRIEPSLEDVFIHLIEGQFKRTEL